MIPGDPEREAEAIRSKQGIPLVPAVVDDLRDIAETDRHPVRLTLRFDMSLKNPPAPL